MKKTRIAMVFVAVITVILELLPFGAVCNFASGPNETIRETFSYFSLVPFGNANFAPFLTAICTCLLLVLAIVACFRESHILKRLIFSVSIVSMLLSLAPLLYGVSFYSFVGALISVMLFITVLVSAVSEKEKLSS